jgi:predicted phosphodiesterase
MIALISDIHGNSDALNAVLDDIRNLGIKAIWCLGDIVGYGAEPAQCIELVKKNCIQVVVGNHDRLAVEGENLSYLSEHVRAGILWARKELSPEQTDWLISLPFSCQEENVTAVHASLCHPEDFSYLDTDQEARLHFLSQETPFSFVGHTHVPMITIEKENSIEWKELKRDSIQLDKTLKYSINVGSVGQPRDEDINACYAIYDPFNSSIQIKRVEYDILAAQRRITEAGLPQVNAARLSVGR